ncbi:hypothetical protein OOZ15_18430 [Galbibacter sp. EGI 63066]|uniref:hypothetical protein n=1 Tax=Galbibacter sp. EGI 63066 TaxID=2993559 RepID=UPI0022499825|nr:hypothetical protein [Galbibacter sp. EGI 63066]MCX2681934.1 hypothetical protein [Galbibacter sp. EGI 63066]
MEDINYIKHLNGVFEQFSKDSRLNPTHISLYIALFQFWNFSFFKEEFYINREEVMHYAKIGSTATYHKCIKELSHWKYILYTPSHNPFKGSKVRMFNFETSIEQAVNDSRTKNQTSAEQALIPIIKHIQTRENNKNINKRGNFKNSNPQLLKNGNKPDPLVQNRDNLKTSSDKDYNEPL